MNNNSFDIIIKKIKEKSIESVTLINDKKLTQNSISIVMTTNNRVRQTLYTILTISHSKFNDVEIILVDDSSTPILHEQLSKYGVTITYIRLHNKFWVNPCANYNIGLSYARSNKIIIQNSEVCHIGDVLSYVSKNLTEDNYIIFDTLTALKMELNDEIYNAKECYEKIIEIAMSRLSQKSRARHGISMIGSMWYTWAQHHTFNNWGLNYLIAVHKKNLLKMGNGFDFEFMNGSCYDDGEFIFRINNVLNLPIHYVNSKNTKIMGIHQCHSKNVLSGVYTGCGINEFLYHAKKTYFLMNNKWPSQISYNTNDFLIIYYIENINLKIPFEKIINKNNMICITIGEKTIKPDKIPFIGISHTLIAKYMYDTSHKYSRNVQLSFTIYTSAKQTVGKLIRYNIGNSQKKLSFLSTGYCMSLTKQHIIINATLGKHLFFVIIDNFTYGDNIIIENFDMHEITTINNNKQITIDEKKVIIPLSSNITTPDIVAKNNIIECKPSTNNIKILEL